MKKFGFFSALLLLLSLSACRTAQAPTEPITLFPPVSQTASVPHTEAAAQTTQPVVNKTYGQTLSHAQTVQVADTAETYRTEDSYRFEQQAVDAALKKFTDTLYAPNTFTVLRSNVWNCVDDGKTVYYSVSVKASYTVESGETIENVFFADIGIGKADGTAFDASGKIGTVVEAYAVFRDVPRDHAPIDTDDLAAAAQQIASQRLKYPDTASALTVQRGAQDEEETVDGVVICRYDVFCTAENDYGMRITDRYTVYLAAENGKIVEKDPMA